MHKKSTLRAEIRIASCVSTGPNLNEIKTEIVISASAETIWKILIDFSAYASWNPFITKISGEAKKDGKISFVATINHVGVPISARVLSFEENKRFSWGGPDNALLKIAVSAEHYLEIEELSPNECRLIHGEKFSGLIPDATWILLSQSKSAYQEMNLALRKRAEK